MNTKIVRKKTIARLKENNIPIHPYLPLNDSEGLRSSEEICGKIISLYSLAGLANGAAGSQLKDWLDEEDGWKYFSE